MDRKERRERDEFAAKAERAATKRSGFDSLHRKDAKALRRLASLARSNAPLAEVQDAYYALDTEVRDRI